MKMLLFACGVLPLFVPLVPAQPGPAAPAPALSFVVDRAARLQFPGDPALAHWLEGSDDLQQWIASPVSAHPVAPGRFEVFEAGAPNAARRHYRIVARPDTAAPVPARVQRQIGNLGSGSGSSSHAYTTAYPESVLVPVGDPAFGAGATAANRLTPLEMEEAMAQGLVAWRRVGTHGSCVGCHAPDAYDLAAIGYSDADITRRALDHVTPGEAGQVVLLVKAVRQKYGIERPLHPQNFRPLQPGHEVLPGASHANRDQAFAQYLSQEVGLIWARDRIESR